MLKNHYNLDRAKDKKEIDGNLKKKSKENGANTECV